MKEELCEKVVAVRYVCDIVVAVVLVSEADVIRLICRYVQQGG